jgi:integrase/recombinase XerD
MSDLNPSGTPERESMEACESLAAVLDDYREWIRSRGLSKTSPTDHVQKLTHFRKFLARRGLLNEGRVNWLDINRDIIAEYQAYIFDYTSRQTGKKLACNTQINYLFTVQTFFRFLKSTKRIALNPANVIKLPRPPQLLPAVLLKPVEMRRLLAVPDVKTVLGFRDRTILEVLWSSAPRMSELLALTIEDLDFKEGLLTIRQGKGQTERVVPIGAGALAWMGEYLYSIRRYLRKLRRSPETRIIFLNRYGQPMQISGWEYKMQVYVRRARISPLFTAHSFRHQLASDMLKNGADLRHIQQMLGHENLTTTQRYLHVVKTELLKVHGQTHPKERLPVQPVTYRGSHDD